jgi:site-specific DNA-methyltransferase (adenine-specific)
VDFVGDEYADLDDLIGLIHNCDCLKFMKKIKDNCIDLVFADPPYNLSRKKGLGWKFSSHVTMHEAWDMFKKDKFFDFNLKWITECVRLLKPGGSLWVCGTFHNIYQLGFILQNLDGVNIANSVVWFKPNAQPNITCRMFTENTEYLIWAVKGGRKRTFNYKETKERIFDRLNPPGKQTRNVWAIPAASRWEKWATAHPNMKPMELLSRIILSCSKKGDIVFDPFAGSGITAFVANEMGRRFLGCERYSEYFRKVDEMFKRSKTISGRN